MDQSYPTRTLKQIEELPGADDFSDTFWLLNEQEHGSETGERLHGFAELINRTDRTPQVDADILIPWLTRYLWEVPYSRYTTEAWRTLVAITPDPPSLSDLAAQIVQHHPHGELRSAVMALVDYTLPAYLDVPTTTALFAGLAMNDPHPDVRVAALRAMNAVDEIESRDQRMALLIRLLKTDPAAEVRLVAMKQLAESGSSPEVQAAFMAALADPTNVWILPEMMYAQMQAIGWSRPRNPDAVVAVLNVMAKQQDHPRYPDMLRTLVWVAKGADAVDGPAARLWLKAAPFANGAAFVDYQQALFADIRVLPADRAFAMTLLEGFDRMTPPGATYAFFADPVTDGAALGLAADAAWTIRAMVAAGDDPVAVVAPLLTRSFAMPKDQAAASAPFSRRLVETLVETALKMDAPKGQPLLDYALAQVTSAPVDISGALFPLRNSVTSLDVSGMQRVVEQAKRPYAGPYVAAYIAERYATFRDPVTLGMIVALLENQTSVEVLSEIAGELPSRADLADAPDDLARLTAAMTIAATRKADEEWQGYLTDRITSWLQ